MSFLSLLAPFAAKIFGFLLLAFGLAMVYFGIKRKGVVQERARWEKAISDAKGELHEKVLVAVGKDAEIDRRVENEKDKIKEANKLPTGGSGNKFTF